MKLPRRVRVTLLHRLISLDFVGVVVIVIPGIIDIILIFFAFVFSFSSSSFVMKTITD